MIRMTIDHEEIREWAERQQAKPTLLPGSPTMRRPTLRLMEPRDRPPAEARKIDWDQFFDLFEEWNLALVFIGGDENEGQLLDRSSAEDRIRAAS